MSCHNSTAQDKAGVGPGVGADCGAGLPACAATAACIDHDGDGGAVTLTKCVAKTFISTSNDCVDSSGCKAWERCIDHDANPATAKGSTVKGCRPPSGNSAFLSSYPVLAPQKGSHGIPIVIYT